MPEPLPHRFVRYPGVMYSNTPLHCLYSTSAGSRCGQPEAAPCHGEPRPVNDSCGFCHNKAASSACLCDSACVSSECPMGDQSSGWESWTRVLVPTFRVVLRAERPVRELAA